MLIRGDVPVSVEDDDGGIGISGEINQLVNGSFETGDYTGWTLQEIPDVPGLESIRTRGRRRLRKIGAGPDTVLLRTPDGSPWVVAGRTSGVSYLRKALDRPLFPELWEVRTAL